MDNENLIENLVIIIKQNIADIRNFILSNYTVKPCSLGLGIAP